jgi:hypothetical protein
VTFGGHLDQSMEFKGTTFAKIWRGLWELIFVLAGMAGNQVFEWSDLDSEIKTAGLKDVSGASCLSQRGALLIVPYRILLPLRTCTRYVCYGITAANCANDFRMVNGNMRHNWRSGKSILSSTASDFDKVCPCLAAYSYLNENLPIAYVTEQPQCMPAVDYTVFNHTDTVFLYSDRFAYTKETYNRPQKVWSFVSVSPFIASSNILLIEVSVKSSFSATSRP